MTRPTCGTRSDVLMGGTQSEVQRGGEAAGSVRGGWSLSIERIHHCPRVTCSHDSTGTKISEMGGAVQ